MFNVGGGEIMVVLLLALLVLGPDKLPEYTRKMGRFLAEFRRMTSGFQDEFRSAMDLGATDPASGSGDALGRTTDGPRLAPAPPPVAEATPIAPDRPAAGAIDAASTPSTDEVAAPASASGPATPAAPVGPVGPASTPPGAEPEAAPAPGPELITPGRPSSAPHAAPVDPEGDHGSSSTSAA